jgi:hypothetical protein
MKVTYLLGAGASYKAIPIIGELNNAFDEMKKLCDLFIKDELYPNNIKDRKLFNSHMTTGAYNAKIYGTIDTFAKKLALTNPENLIRLKGAISLFFTLWQEIDKKELGDRGTQNGKTKQPIYADIDDRYFGLLANFLEKDIDKIILNENVNFISWNYDAQLELATAFFLDSSLEDILLKFSVYPYVNNQQSKIVHLNGMAGIFKDPKDNKMKSLYSKSFEYERKTAKLFEDKLFFMSATENSNSQHSDYFTYAWEDDPISKKAIEPMF